MSPSCRIVEAQERRVHWLGLQPDRAYRSVGVSRVVALGASWPTGSTGPNSPSPATARRFISEPSSGQIRMRRGRLSGNVSPMEEHRSTPRPLCGDRIGVYDQMIGTRYGGRRTSRAREPVLPECDPILLPATRYGIEPYGRGEHG